MDERAFDAQFEHSKPTSFALTLARAKAAALVRSGGSRWLLCADQVGVLEEAGGVLGVRGVRLEGGAELRAHATILTTGTFLRAIMHTGEATASGGRVGERSADGLSGDVERLGLRLGLRLRLRLRLRSCLERGGRNGAVVLLRIRARAIGLGS